MGQGPRDCCELLSGRLNVQLVCAAFPAAQHFYCRIAYTLTGSGCRSTASETMPRIGCAVHSRCLDTLFQLRYETGTSEGLAIAEAE